MIGIGINTTLRGSNATVVPLPVATAATSVDSNSFTANWNAYTGASYYLLDVSLNSSFSSYVLQDQVTTSTSYVVTGLSPSTTYYYRVRANVGTDPDAQAFFERVATAGGTLSETEQTAIDTLVIQMKADRIWSKMKAIYPMVGASAAACAQNLKSSSFTGTFTATGWTFSSTGVTGNGTSTYMDTGLSPNTTMNYNSQSYFIYKTTVQSGTACEFGVVDGNYRGIGSFLNLGYHTINEFVLDNPFTGSTTAGAYILSRNNSNDKKLFFNGSLFQTITSVATNFTLFNIYLGARNDNNTGQTWYTDTQTRFFSIGDGLTDTEASNFNTAVQGFNTTLGRYVGAPWYDNGELLLDAYPNSAAAYSLRKLRNNYVGGPIRVRRSSDNTEQDIYFNANGELDTAQLTAFCGAGNGFVTTWYDQSGNGRNATQTTAANQPQIVSSGSTITENGKPCVNFNGNNILEMTLISSSTEISIVSISKNTPTGAYQTILGVGFANGYALTTEQNKYNLFYRNVADQRTTNNALSTQALIFAYTKSATNQQLYANNVSFQNITPPTMLTPTTSSRIGAYDSIDGIYQGTQQELIVYPSDQLSNRTGIESNINSFYSIY